MVIYKVWINFLDTNCTAGVQNNETILNGAMNASSNYPTLEAFHGRLDNAKFWQPSGEFVGTLLFFDKFIDRKK